MTRLPLIKVLAAFVQNNSYEYHKIHYFQQRAAEVMASKTSTGSSGIGTSCHKKVFCPSMELGLLWWPLSFIYLFVFFWGGVCTITLQVLIFKPWRVLNVLFAVERLRCGWVYSRWFILNMHCIKQIQFTWILYHIMFVSCCHIQVTGSKCYLFWELLFMTFYMQITGGTNGKHLSTKV